MSYEICVFDAAFAGSKEAAAGAWDDSSYWDASQLDYERSGRKWRIKEALMAFNPALTCTEPKVPPTGFLAKAFSKPPPICRYLTVDLITGDEFLFSFDIYDQAVEINLSWDAKADQVQGIVRDVWRHLETLSQLGFSTMYDTEREVLLNLEADFDAVVQGYIRNLELDGDAASAETAPSVTPPQASVASVPRQSKTSISGTPFSGNVAEAKPWWKLW